MEEKESKQSVKTFFEKMEVEKPSKEVVDKYIFQEKKSWWNRIVTSVDTWHRWVDLILKILVSGVIVTLLWRWLSFVIEMIEKNMLSDSVQITLVSGSTVNLIGLLAIMARYLFSK